MCRLSRASSPHDSSWPAIGIVLLGLASLLMLGRLVGCGSTTPPVPPAANRGDPAELLRQMIAKYREAASYADHGQLRLSLTRNGVAARPQSWDATVKFERPGRLKVDAYNLQLASDATASEPKFVARVEDAESSNIDNQVVVRPAPEKMTFEALTLDPILFSQLIGRIQRPPVQLELLLGEKPLATLLASDVKLSWLDDASTDGRTCHRIEAAAPEGKFVFWIDPDQLLLRRLDYPAAALLPDLASDKTVSELEFVAELKDASFGTTKTEFALEIPANAKRMRAFVMPVIALDARLLGQEVRAFDFTLLDGQRIRPGSIKGQPTAFFWYAHHAACEKPAQEFAAAAKKFADDLHAFAICTETPDVGDKAVRDQLDQWKVDLQPARDLKAYHNRVFEVHELPAISLLDAEGRFQWMGSGPSAVAEFPEAVTRLLNGENLAAEALERERLLREQYDKLVAAGGPRLDTGPAAASSPKRLKLTRKWKVDKLSDVGGLGVKSTDDGDRLLVVVGRRDVLEVSPSGEVVARQVLGLPKDAEISALRSFSGKQSRIYAVFTPLKAGVHVFNEGWKPLFTYPEGDDSPPVRDVQLGDLDQNDEPELLVAFEGNVGLHSVSLDGKRLWSNRAYAPLLSVAPSHDLPVVGRCAYVTGRGGICPITKGGIESSTKDVAGWTIAHLFTSQFASAAQSPYLGIGVSAKGEPCIVGIHELLTESWNYPLPDGAFKQPIDFVTSGKLRTDSAGEWVVAWADGSIHIVSEDGQFDDMFNTGVEIRGVALLRGASAPLLVVSTPTEVLAWEVRE
jgi:hypothetical protein